MDYKTHDLISRFNHAIGWNAFSYFVYRALATTTTFVLFSSLSSSDFSRWALVTSITYLILLWADPGFRFSVPRYCPEFAKNSQWLGIFTRRIIISQTIIIGVLGLIALLVARHSEHATLIWYGIGLMLSEGLASVTRTIYHAHFWQKTFNLMASLIHAIQSIGTLLAAATLSNSSMILPFTLSIKILSAAGIGIGALLLLPYMYRRHELSHNNEAIDGSMLFKEFIRHSGIMWCTTLLKSVSERNFIVPLLAATQGQVASNIFKVAAEGALFFQRLILKTIGTSDTALLSYTQAGTTGESGWSITCKKLTERVAALCSPFLGIVLFLFLQTGDYVKHYFAFHIFYVLVTAYLLELYLLPFMRVMEVKRRYAIMIVGYALYGISLVMVSLLNVYTCIGLHAFVLCIQGVRLVSIVVMSGYTYYEYRFSYPVRLVGIYIGMALAMAVAADRVAVRLGLTPLIKASVSRIISFDSIEAIDQQISDSAAIKI